MNRLKRPKLATRYSGPRAGNRDCVSLEGRCRVGDGEAAPIAILDLDAGGCRIKGITVAVTKMEPLRLWFGEVGPVAGRLRWVKRGSAGIAFDTALGPDELALAVKTAAPAPTAQVIPLRRGRSEVA